MKTNRVIIQIVDSLKIENLSIDVYSSTVMHVILAPILFSYFPNNVAKKQINRFRY